ncbi:MAG: hypothetical protein WDN06_04645 [Asticcacaulis sp.]
MSTPPPRPGIARSMSSPRSIRRRRASTARAGSTWPDNSFDHLEAHVRLLDPSRLGKGLTADDLHADLMFDGAFQDWKVDYDIAAKRFAIGDIKLAGAGG